MSESVKRTPSRSRAAAGGERVAAATFKARCLELMDRVRETGAQYIVTKHGRPVARLVPYKGKDARRSFGSMKGSVLRYDRPLESLDDDYDIDRA
jgi:prevent-host-death family protein